uniref:ATP synthase F0 subunit 8 n=1 Tax=Gelidiella fanii TaxID=485435 RepID=A0A7G9IVS6_9FLOR|nr:ATP synthase F0 subunit 8 [Gelidiella fanii]QNM39470.1 ATP synthase F0 subunit 8 [Gelidiella fanii]QNM39493.1 ATP synthase F0 subunit 8 [Gelidiella fanii]
MPQLDHIIIFSQIFWLFIVFILFYTTITHFFLPKFLKVLRARKLIAKVNSEKVTFIANKSSKNKIRLLGVIMKNLTTVKKILNSTSTFNTSNFNITKTNKIDELVGKTVKNSVLFCNFQILDSINVYSKLIQK